MAKGGSRKDQKKRFKDRPHPKSYKRLRSKGVADKEKFLRGCMAVIGILFLLFAAAMVYQWLFGGG